MVDRTKKRLRTGGANVAKLDRLIHGRIRLGILSVLAINDRLQFNDLKRLVDTTDGNLSVHARKLEEAGYISCRKYFDDRTPRTEYSLTEKGRQAFSDYLERMETLIGMVRKSR